MPWPEFSLSLFLTNPLVGNLINYVCRIRLAFLTVSSQTSGDSWNCSFEDFFMAWMFSFSLWVTKWPELKSIISWRGCSTLLGHYWYVLIDCYWWKIRSDLIDLNSDAPSSGRLNQLVFPCTLWTRCFPSGISPELRRAGVETRPGLQIVSFPIMTLRW